MRQLVPVVLSFVALICGNVSWGQDYPKRPVRIVVGFAPGGTADVITRVMATQLQRQTGVSFVVDNRAGAGGIVGFDLVAKAEPDGYTLLSISPSYLTTVVTYRKLPFDPQKDFVPITVFATGNPNLLVVSPAFPAKSIGELISLAKSRDKSLTHGSPLGAMPHFAGELFKLRAGIPMLHVPYKGQAPAIIALLGGEIDIVFLQPPAGVDMIKAGKLRALGFGGASRWLVLPDVPTIAESGVPGFKLERPFTGMLAPAKTPAQILTRIRAEISKAFEAPQVQAFFSASDLQPERGSSEEFRNILAAETKRLTEIAREAKMAPQ